VEGGANQTICELRKQRKIDLDSTQTLITDYFKVLDEIEVLAKENEKLSRLISQCGLNPYSIGGGHGLTPILKQMLINAEKNVYKYPTQRRHSELLKKFATALFIYSGPLCYDFLHQNMPQALPSLRSVQNIIHSQYKVMHEGTFRFSDLAKHIANHNAPKIVSIGEDATRVIGRVDYDSETDRCVGFVLPVDDRGLPLVDSFLATSFSAIENMFGSATIAKYAYVYMAQPLGMNVPPFCLACFGTDQKFTAEHVLQRWQLIYLECAKRGITVVSFGGDGDSRVMRAMKIAVSLIDPPKDLTLETNKSSISVNPAWKSWFCISPTAISYVQDVVHIAVKFKARLLNPRVNLKLGPLFEAGAYHLEQLRSKYGKEDHFLRDKDLNHLDRQNYDAVLHIINACPLLVNIPGACATKYYIEIIQNVVDSYEDKSLNCIDRIEKIWYANFFLRYWRKWIVLHHSYTLKSNFITQNCYMCVELNAHALVIYVLTIRDHFQGEGRNFLPWMLGSQTCEKTFRTVRSMSSVFSTVLNFSILGLLRRLHCISIQLTLQADLQDTVKFPSVEKHRNKEGKNELFLSSLRDIGDDEISEAVDRAKAKARNTVQELGMDKLLKVHSVWDKENTTDDLIVDVKTTDDNDDEDNVDDYGLDYSTNEKDGDVDALAVIREVCLETQEQVSKDIQSVYEGGVVSKEAKEKLHKYQKALRSFPVKKLPSDTIPMYSLKDYKDLDSCLTGLGSNAKQVISPFVEVRVKERVVLIRKTTAIWLFQETERVSADRLFRVRLKQPYNSVKCLEPSDVAEKIDTPDTSTAECCRQNDDHDPVEEVLKSTAVAKGTLAGSVVEFHGQNDHKIVKKSDAVTKDTTDASTVECDRQNDHHNLSSKSDMLVENTSAATCPKRDAVRSKVLRRDEMACVHDAIIINDENGRGNADSIEICKKADEWLKVGCYVLHIAERDMLHNNEWLTDLHMNAVQVLIKKQFPHIGGLQNTSILQLKRTTKPFQDGKGSLQIIHINNNHWVVASTMNCTKNVDIIIYDSLNSSVSIETQTILASLLKTKEDKFTVQISKVNKQSGTKDCGAFAAAYCTTVAFGQDPSSLVYDQKHLRHHLLKCLEDGKMSIFPTIRERRTASTFFSVDVFCMCRGPDTGECL